jgi:alkylation response protein AidB-like acyl-CoA dehydrogenase
MDFGFSEEQEQLRRQVRRFADERCPMDRVRELMDSDDAFDKQMWASMAELGWLGLAVPEQAGGLGLNWEDVVVVAEELGRSLLPSPFLAVTTAARAVDLLGSEAQKAELLAPLAEGTSVVTLAFFEDSDVIDPDGVATTATADGDGWLTLSGTKMFVPWGQSADKLLLVAREGDGLSVFAVDSAAEGLTVEPLQLIDTTCRAARVSLDSVRVEADSRLGAAGQAWPLLSRALDAGLVALCAEMVGAADGSLQLTTEFAKVRQQFGSPIGRFQGVKHRLAEIYVATESARSLTYYASWAVDHLDDAASSVAMAKEWAAEALDRAGEEGVQLHGAIGYTWECDAHLYYKRGRLCRNLMGSPDYQRERLLVAQGL